MKKIIFSFIIFQLAFSVAHGVTVNKSIKGNSEVNPILPYHLCADPTAVEYNGRLYVYGTDDQQELEATGDSTNNTYGKITQLVCMSTADMVNWTFHGTINVKSLATWTSTSWAPSIVSREEEDGLTHFYLYFTNSASGIGVLTSTSPTGPWKDPLGHALINGSTPGRGEQSNIIDPGVCIDDDGNGWLSFGGGSPNKYGSTLMPGNARIVKLGKDMISLDGDIISIPAPFHFEANELNYIDGKFIFSYSGGWSCNADDWSAYEGKGNYDCPGNCSIMAMSTDDPVNGTWTYMGEILKNPGQYGYSWGNNHSHLQKFGSKYYMVYHTQYIASKLGLTGGYRGIAINEAKVTSTAITTTMDNSGPSFIQDNAPKANEVIEAETMSNSAGVVAVRKSSKQTLVNSIDAGDWTMIRGLTFTEDARSMTIHIKGKGTLKLYSGRPAGTPIVTAEFNNTKMADATFDLTNKLFAGKTYSYLYLLFEEVDDTIPIEFDSYHFNAQSAEEITGIEAINADDNDNDDDDYNDDDNNVTKCIEKGRIVIKKGGITYNAIGTRIK